ncbi:MAG: FKBP-type peptidyl-prolyl cis-trans isomerase [Bacteroidales bacterium]|nr:FKBP-type peptidyl-prolyl cis-trans isomerase [Bacteroidales bacterium]
MIRYYISIIVTLLFFISCNESKITGYKLTDKGIYFKLLGIGEANKYVQEGNYVTFHIQYATADDSIFFDAIRTAKIEKPLYEGAIEDCFYMLSEGDSAAFFIKADPFFEKTLESPLPLFIPPESYLKIILKIETVKTAEEFKKDKEEFLAWVEDFGEYEKKVLKNYLEKRNINYMPNDTVIYKIPINKGNSKTVNYGDTITVHFEGYFLNGKLFDSTRKRNEPFSFVYGSEWQVIKGLEKAIGMMHEGEKSIFVIPSFMAFGKEGSSTGIIPPYSSVVFEIELLKIGKKNE